MKKTIFTALPATPLCCGGCCVAIARPRRQILMFAFGTAFFLSSPVQMALSQGNNYEGPVGVSGIFNGNISTGCSYDPLTHSSHREVTDIVVPGSIGKYPLKMTRYYNSRQQYYAGTAIGLGPGWAHEYSWLLYTAGEKVVSPHGNVYDFHCGPPVGVSESWDDGLQGPHPNGGTWRLADGGKVHFLNGSQVDYIEDPYGLRTTIEYQNGRRWRVTEPGGRCLIFTYGPAQDADGTLMLTKAEAYDYYGGHRIDSVSYSYREYNPVDPLPQGRQPKMMLRTVTYSDGTSATYDYTYDNVREDAQHGTFKMFPLLQSCDDVRYGGPMRTIFYDYQNGGPHGAITLEKYSARGSMVSSIDPGAPTGGGDLPETFTETRGDGPSRSFAYNPFHHYTENICDDYENNDPPQQMLKNYTDFQGKTTWIHYNTNWYIDGVTDARGTEEGDPNHTTNYTRGPAPPQGIGQITRITHPGGDHIDYTYTGTNGGPWYVMKITDERGNQTIHTRDINHRITQTDYKDASNVLLARETFTYCDQADANQCGPVNPITGQMHGQIKRHQLKNGAYVHYRYDSQGRGLLIDKWEPTWTSSASENEPKTHYEYYGPNDRVGGNLWIDRVMTVTGPPPNWAYSSQASETYEYDRALGANGITDPTGAVKAGRGLVTKITHADSKFQRFAYDAFGNKRGEDNELRNATSYTYDEYNRLLNVTRPLNGITNYTYNPTNGGGSRLSHTTSNPDTVTVRTSARTPSITTRNVYDENFRKTSTTAADGTSQAATTWFHYDPVGNQDYVTDPRGTGPGDPQYTTTTDYDNRNRKWHVWDAQGHRTTFGYDEANNIIRIDRPDGGWETKFYDGLNQVLTNTVLKSAGVTILTQFQYYPYNVQSASLLKKVIDGENHNYQFEYDPSGLKTKLSYHDGSSQSWAYDDAHNLKSRTTVAGEIQNFAYDNRNRKTGEWWDGFPADGEWRIFDYDDANHLTLATNGTGNPWTNFIADVRRSYDDAGRLTQDQQKVYVNGVPITKNVNYPSYDDDGRLTRMYVDSANPAYDYTFSYDPMRRFEKIFGTGQPSPFFQYHYDAASNETQRDNLFNGVLQIYSRDNLNRMQNMDLKKGGNTLGHEGYGYDSASRLQSVTREDNKQDRFTYYKNGELNVATYGAAPTATPTPPASPTPPPGQVVTPTFRPDGAYYSTCANSYTFNVLISTTTSGASIRWTTDGTNWNDMGNGQIAAFTVAANQTKTLQAYAYKAGMNNSTVHSADYSFDRECGQGPSYPLDNAGVPPAGPVEPDLTGTFTYTLDKAGNRTAVNGTSYTPNTINQYTSVAGSAVTNGSEHEIELYYGFTYHYMRDQELKQITATNFTYDFAYDAFGRCVKRTVNDTLTTYYFYDGDKPILEYDASNALVGFNVYGKGVDEIVERGAYGVGNIWHWYFLQQDHEGSVTHLTDANGAIIERYRYDAFGTPSIYAPNWTVRTASSYNNRFLFTGREYLGAWVYDYRARVYHAYLGRFMSEDPKLFDAGDYNLFRYCHNDPIDFTDPMGLDGIPNGDGTYHFVLRSDVVVPNIIGSYVVNKSDGIARQCAGAAQFLTGTRMADGTLHDAPTARHDGWTQGPALTKETPNGTMVARGWKNGTYPNESPEQAKKNGSKILNHTGIKMGWDDNSGKAIILDQWQGENGSLQKRLVDPSQGDWSVVNATKPHDPKPSESDFNVQIKKGTQDALGDSSSVIHSKPKEVLP